MPCQGYRGRRGSPCGARRASPALLAGGGTSCTSWYMLEVTRQRNAPVDRLWTAISDVRHWPQWLPTVDAGAPFEPGRLRAPHSTGSVTPAGALAAGIGASHRHRREPPDAELPDAELPLRFS